MTSRNQNVAGLVEKELGRRRVPQTRRTGGPQAELVQVATFVRGKARRRSLLDQLLVPALDRAVALAEGDDRPERVAEELDLDMAGGPDLAFEVDGAVPERGQGLGRRRGERRRQVRRRGDAAHPPPSPAGRGLDEQGVADALRLGEDALELVRPVDGSGLQRARHHRHAGFGGRPARSELVAEGKDRRRRGTDEDQPRLLHGAGERCPLRQEAVPGMDRLGAGGQRRLHDCLDPQVALGRRGGPDPDGDIGGADVSRAARRHRCRRHGLDAQLPAGAEDPDCDLAAVRDEQAVERPSADRAVFAQRRHRTCRVGRGRFDR